MSDFGDIRGALASGEVKPLLEAMAHYDDHRVRPEDVARYIIDHRGALPVALWMRNGHAEHRSAQDAIVAHFRIHGTHAAREHLSIQASTSIGDEVWVLGEWDEYKWIVSLLRRSYLDRFEQLLREEWKREDEDPVTQLLRQMLEAGQRLSFSERRELSRLSGRLLELCNLALIAGQTSGKVPRVEFTLRDLSPGFHEIPRADDKINKRVLGTFVELPYLVAFRYDSHGYALEAPTDIAADVNAAFESALLDAAPGEGLKKKIKD